MLRLRADRRVLGRVAVHLPHRPEPVDVAMVEVEDRVERRDRRVAHVAADIAVEPVVHLTPRRDEGAELVAAAFELALEVPVVGLAEYRPKVRGSRQAIETPDVSCQAGGGGAGGGVEAPAGEAGWPPRGEGGRVRARPGLGRREVA